MSNYVTSVRMVFTIFWKITPVIIWLRRFGTVLDISHMKIKHKKIIQSLINYDSQSNFTQNELCKRIIIEVIGVFRIPEILVN